MRNPCNNYKEYLAEAEDIVNGLNKNLYVLKSRCNSAGEPGPDVVNALFRDVHTLKGISEVTGLPKVSTLSHRLEDLLDCLRFGRIDLDYDVVETLFEVADVLTELLKGINDKGIENAEIGPAINRIGTLMSDKIHDTVHDECASLRLDEHLGNLSDFEQYRITESVKQGNKIYKVIVDIPVDMVDSEMSGLREHLSGRGEVIAIIPASALSADDRVSFEIIYSSKTPPSPPFSKRGEGGEPGFSCEITGIRELVRVNDTCDDRDHGQNHDAEGAVNRSARSVTKTVRVDIERLEELLNDVGEVLLLNSYVTHSVNGLRMKYGQSAEILDAGKSNRLLHRKISLLRSGLIDIRLVPIGFLFSRLYRIVELLSKDLSKKIRLEVSGGDTRLDRSMIEELADPLMHIIRNAIDHGIEDEALRMKMGKVPEGLIKIRAGQKESNVVIDIEDDGRGIDYDLVYDRAIEMGLISHDQKDEKSLKRALFMPGFTTKSVIDDISGRGVGLDVVSRNIADLSGMIDVDTAEGKGTTFRITLPVTLLIVRALIVSASGREYALPVNSVSENLRLRECDITMIRDRECINLRGDYLPLVRLKDVLVYPGSHKESIHNKGYVIIAGLSQKKMGIIVDKIHGQREILIKHPGKFLKEIQYIAGFAEVEAKKIVPVIDLSGLADRMFAAGIPS